MSLINWEELYITTESGDFVRSSVCKEAGSFTGVYIPSKLSMYLFVILIKELFRLNQKVRSISVVWTDFLL